MMKKALLTATVAAGTLAGIGLTSWADEDDYLAMLAKALREATVSLDQGLRASEKFGKPISGKYEIENGRVQLSVYTDKSGRFSEIIVDHRTGAVLEPVPITDPDDLDDAEGQSEVMATAKVS